MSWRTVTRTTAFCAAALGLAAGAGAQAFASAHWKSKIDVEGAPAAEGREGRGGRAPSDYEIWMKAGKMRMKASAGGMAMNMLKQGDNMYTWVDGTGQGMKINVAMGQRDGRPTHDYVNKVDDIRAKGKKVGSERIDGHPCDIWEYQSDKGEKGRYWLAQDLKGFPVQAVVEPARGGKVTYHNTDIQIPASVSDDMFALPRDVEFRDISEMQRGGPPRN
jgi:hypothetical protein